MKVLENFPDFLKVINNRITKNIIIYFGFLTMLLSGFMMGRITTLKIEKPEVKILPVGSSYLSSDNFFNSTSSNSNNSSAGNLDSASSSDSIPDSFNKGVIFGSSKGKYFYYKGCGGNTISPKNLVYYKSEAEALAAGKTLYSKCK